MTGLRPALRQVKRHAGFSAAIVAMLAVGIGTTTAIFSLFYTILMQPLPVPEPGELVNLGAPGPKWGSTSCRAAGACEYVFSYPMFRDLEARQDVFTGIAGHSEFDANLAYRGETAASTGLLVSGSYFDVLRLRPALGRLLGPEDEPQIGGAPVVVLAHDYWRTQLGADPTVIGSTLTVNGQALTIVGVAPEGFEGTTVGARPTVFVPVTLRWLMEPTARQNADDRRAYWVYLFARLRPGVSMAQASARLNTLYGGILNEVEAPLNSVMPPEILARFRQRQVTMEPGARGQSRLATAADRPLGFLFGATTAVLLVVCLNIANLLLAQGIRRSAEMAIRVSLGATRSRLVGQSLTVCLLLAVLGGTLSLPIAGATLAGIVAIAPPQTAGGMPIEIDAAAVLFAAGASLATVILFGLMPALKSTQTDPVHAIKSQSTQAAALGLSRFRGTLTVAQIALSLVLLVLAGLFAQSLANVARVNLGIEVDTIVTFNVAPRLNGYDEAETMLLYDGLEDTLAGLPGVTGVASARVPLIADSNARNSLSVQGFDAAPGADTNASSNWVGPAFFETLSIPLLAGRYIDETDRRDAPRVAVVNQRFVEKFALGERAVGTRFGLGGRAEYDIEIVGVVADSKYSSVKDDTPPQYFLARRQDDNLRAMSYYVRADLEPDALMRMIRRAAEGVDPTLPLSGMATMRRVVQNSVFLDRLVAWLSAAFAILATLLAAIGLYSVLAYQVAQRTRELGLRLALGSTPGGLRLKVLAQVGKHALIGGGIGLVCALLLGRLAEALLFGLSGTEPLVLIGAAVVVSAVAVLAGLIPAERAARVAPMEALRYE